jgi:hypothetical protein
MRTARALAIATTPLALVLLLAFTAAGAGLVKHSGNVERIDPGGGKLVLAEVGPWRERAGKTVITARTIELTASTVYRSVSRADGAPSGFQGDFVRREITLRDVSVGDRVTAECERLDGRLVARTITVVPVER